MQPLLLCVKNFRRFAFCLLAFAAVVIARATTMIYPVEAIDDLWNLPADDFKTKYAGINITGLGPSDEGWYVRYRHENLTYLFGPLADSEAAQKKKWDLETVRDAAIRNRPSLTSSKVDYVKFNYSGVYGKGGGNTPYKGKKGDGSGGGDGDDKNGSGSGGDRKDGSGSGKDGSGKDGTGSGDGDSSGNGDKLAGGDGTDGSGGANGDGSGNQSGSGKDGKGGKGGKDGQSGSGDGSGDGSGNDDGGVVGAGKNGALQKVASAKGGGSSNGSGGQGGQSGQSGGQGGQGGQQGGSQGGQSGQSGGGSQGGGSSSGGQGGQPGGGSPGGGSSGGGGNPLQLIGTLLKMILGI